MQRKLLALVSASACLAAGLLPTAAAAQDVGTMKVVVGGLDLRSDAGAKLALDRIRIAADRFCDDGSRELSRRAEIAKCRAAMTYRGVTKLDAPLVTARYEGTGASPAIQLARR
ncbi:UrcA family protein [Phenylobacterium soli]